MSTKLTAAGGIGRTLQEAIKLQAEIDRLTDQLKHKRDRLHDYMVEHGETTLRAGLGVASLVTRDKWSYSPEVARLETELKAARLLEQANGLANREQSQHVRITLDRKAVSVRITQEARK